MISLALVLASVPAGRATADELPAPPPLFAQPQKGPPAPDVQSASPVIRTSPAQGARISEARPRVEVTLRAPVPLEGMSIAVDAMDVTGNLRVEGTVAFVVLPQPLQPGLHMVRLFVQSSPVSWTFTYDPSAAPAAQAASAGPRADWSLNVLGTLTAVASGDDPTTARLRLNSRAELQGNGWFARENVDLALREDFRGGARLVQESRNYLVNAGFQGRSGFGADALVGFFSPDFLDQSQLLAIGLARGGVEARVTTPLGSAAAYRSYDARPGGVVSGSFGPSQTIWAGGLQTPTSGRYSLRIIGLEAEDEPGSNTVGGKGLAVGLLGKAAFSSAATFLAEAAHGKYDFNPGGPPSSAGWAFRFGLLGAIESWSYTLNLRQTDDTFVNPANRGFTAGAASDRTGGDLSLTKLFGTVATGISYRHLRGGGSSGFISPSVREDGGNLFASVPVSQILTVFAAGNATWNRAGEDPNNGLPPTDRWVWGGSLTASEKWGRFLFSESYTYQKVDDRVNALFGQIIHTALLSAGGPLFPVLSLNAVASGTRVELAPPAGRTDQLSLSLQPTVLLPWIWLSLQPRLAYAVTNNDALPLSNKTGAVQLLASWEPPWERSLLAIQASADWTRLSALPGSVNTTFRLFANVVVRWSAGSAGVAPSAPPPPPSAAWVPGALPPAPGAANVDPRGLGSNATLPAAAPTGAPPMHP
jgi:hypothetical protein